MSWRQLAGPSIKGRHRVRFLESGDVCSVRWYPEGGHGIQSQERGKGHNTQDTGGMMSCGDPSSFY